MKLVVTENITLNGVIDAAEGWFDPAGNDEEDAGWENTTILRGPLEDEVRALKARPGNEIGVTESISVVHGLVGAGLVDEYRLFVYPVVLGRGARLFADATDVPKLRLVEATPFRSGVALMAYRAA